MTIGATPNSAHQPAPRASAPNPASGTGATLSGPVPSTPAVAAAAARLSSTQNAALDDQVLGLTEVHDSLREALNALDGG